ncbi:MAG: DUF3737 family protein [Ruminococcaceae bacterium]|nr:DUF3737 family protein [Oscillospiraceae bacterium]
MKKLRSNTVKEAVFDEERALYNLRDTLVLSCVFAGPKDGESALKEARDITVEDCRFSLRYPLWHAERFVLSLSSMDELTRAPIWYAKNGLIKDCNINSIKCLRECSDIRIEDCTINSPEFGWKCNGIYFHNCTLTSEYVFLGTTDAKFDGLRFQGKYSFQYTENIVIENSFLDTKDAFWHAKNVTVRNSTLRGEYLAWYSEGLTLENCRIIGTQPLCYCKNLRLINCTMEGTDLSFEKSDVEATVNGNILSVKNPRRGSIIANSIGEIILEPIVEGDVTVTSECKIETKDA